LYYVMFILYAEPSSNYSNIQLQTILYKEKKALVQGSVFE